MTDTGIAALAAKMALGQLDAAELPEAAVSALDAGLDSPALRVLAGLSNAELDEARELLETALMELGVPVPTARDAIMVLARIAASEIANGRITPYGGAKRIWEITLCAPRMVVPELDPFIYAASEWEDRPDDREHFTKEIIREAQRLLAS